jgi:anti-sigma factor RsiW
MLCREFLERHTEFRDGLIASSRESRRFARHMAHCTSCRRYDATIREAVQALHSASPIALSADFRQRLDARPPAQAGVSATMLVIAAFALFFFELAQRPRIARAPLLPAVAFPNAVVSAGLPFVSFQDPRARVVSGNPYPYGTTFFAPASASR